MSEAVRVEGNRAGASGGVVYGGSGSGLVLDVSEAAVLRGNAAATYGGVVCAQALAHLSLAFGPQATLEGNSALLGAVAALVGTRAPPGEPLRLHSHMLRNTAALGGGVLALTANASAGEVEFGAPVTGPSPGFGTPAATACVMAGMQASQGGVLYMDGRSAAAAVAVSGACASTGNAAAGSGGFAYLADHSYVGSLGLGGSWEGNSAGLHGGLVALEGGARVGNLALPPGSSARSNSAASSGGLVAIGQGAAVASLALQGATVVGCRALVGGVVSANAGSALGALRLEGSHLEGNEVQGTGGGCVWLGAGTAVQVVAVQVGGEGWTLGGGLVRR